MAAGQYKEIDEKLTDEHMQPDMTILVRVERGF